MGTINKCWPYPKFPVSSLLNHSPDVSLNEDDGPHFARVHFPDQVSPTPGLEPHNVATQVLELVGKDAGTDQSLETHIASPHLVVLALPIVGSKERERRENNYSPGLGYS